MLQGHSLLQMLEASVQLVVVEGVLCSRSKREWAHWKMNGNGWTHIYIHAPPASSQLGIYCLCSGLAGSNCSNIRDNIWAQINEISLFQRARLKIYLCRVIMHIWKQGWGGEGQRHSHTHTHLYAHTRGTYELNLVSQTEFLILSLGIIVRMWYSDRAPASKPRQDIRSCWSGTLAMQHPDLKCSSGFVVICSSQLSQYRGALQERPLSSSSASHLSLQPLSVCLTIKAVQSAHPSLSCCFCLLLRCVNVGITACCCLHQKIKT